MRFHYRRIVLLTKGYKGIGNQLLVHYVRRFFCYTEVFLRGVHCIDLNMDEFNYFSV